MKQSVGKFLLRGSVSKKLPGIIKGIFSINYNIFRSIFLNSAVLKDFDGDISVKLYPNKSLGQRDYLFFHKDIETELFAFLRNNLKKGMTIIDIGANIGVYSLFFGKYTGSSGQVFSFEASPETFQQLKWNIELNNAANIQPFNFALSNKKEMMTLFSHAYNDGENSLIKNKDNNSGIPTQAITFDELWFNDINKKDAIKIIDLIKIDIEGWELYALEGMTRLIEKYSPSIMMEFNGYKYKASSQASFNFLRSLDYKCCRVKGSELIKVNEENINSEFDDTYLDLIYYKNNSFINDDL